MSNATALIERQAGKRGRSGFTAFAGTSPVNVLYPETIAADANGKPFFISHAKMVKMAREAWADVDGIDELSDEQVAENVEKRIRVGVAVAKKQHNDKEENADNLLPTISVRADKRGGKTGVSLTIKSVVADD